jgi:hypothetical protein
MSLRGVLYNINMLDSHTLFREIHQAGPMVNMYMLVGNMATAEAMVMMMNTNVTAYLTHILPTLGIVETFVKALIRAAINPSLIHKIQYCSWDQKM